MKNKLFFKHILLLIATTTLVPLLSVLILHNTVFAATIPADLKESSEAIQKMAAECYETEHSKKPDQITIDYDSAYGIYIDVDLFSGSSKSFREVMDLCAKAPMCYIVPIQADGQTAIVEVSKGLPLNTSTSSLLTEEEKEEIKSNEGKWVPASLTFETTPQSTEQQVHELLDKNGLSSETDHCLIGGVPGIHDLILVADAGNGCVYIPFDKSISTAYESSANAKDFSNESITADSSEGQSAMISSGSQNIAQTGVDEELKEGQAYSYEDFQKIALKNRQYEQADDIVSGDATAAGHSFGYRVILGIGIGIIIAVAVVLIGMRFKKHRTN